MDSDLPQSPRNNRPLLESALPRNKSAEPADDLFEVVEVDPLEIKEEDLDLDIEQSLHNTSTHIEDSGEAVFDIDNLYVKEEDIAESENFTQEKSSAQNLVLPVIKEVISLNKQKSSAKFSESLSEPESHLLIVKSVIKVKLHKIQSSRSGKPSGKPYHKIGQKQGVAKIIEKPLPEGFIKCIDCGFLINKFQTSKNCRKCGAKVPGDSDLLSQKGGLKPKKLKMSEKIDNIDLNKNSSYVAPVSISNVIDSNNDLKDNDANMEENDFTNKETTVCSTEKSNDSQNIVSDNLSQTESKAGPSTENSDSLERISPTSYFSKLELVVSDAVKEKSIENTKDAILGQDDMELNTMDCLNTKKGDDEIKLDSKINSADGVSEQSLKEVPEIAKIPADKLDLVVYLERIENDLNMIKSAPETTLKIISSHIPSVNTDELNLGNNDKESTELFLNKTKIMGCEVGHNSNEHIEKNSTVLNPGNVNLVGKGDSLDLGNGKLDVNMAQSSKRINIKRNAKKYTTPYFRKRKTLRALKMSEDSKTPKTKDKRPTKITSNTNLSVEFFSKQKKTFNLKDQIDQRHTKITSDVQSVQPPSKQRQTLRALDRSKSSQTSNANKKTDQKSTKITFDVKSAQPPSKQRQTLNLSKASNADFSKERKTSRLLNRSERSEQRKPSKTLNLSKDGQSFDTKGTSEQRSTKNTSDTSKGTKPKSVSENNASFINSFLQFVKETAPSKKDELIPKTQEKLVKIVLNRLPEDVILKHINKKVKKGERQQDRRHTNDKNLQSYQLKTSERILPVQEKSPAHKQNRAIRLKWPNTKQKLKGKARSRKCLPKAVDALHLGLTNKDWGDKIKQKSIEKMSLRKKENTVENIAARNIFNKQNTNKGVDTYVTFKNVGEKHITRVESIDKSRPLDNKIIKENQNEFKGLTSAQNRPKFKYVHFLNPHQEFQDKINKDTPRKTKKKSPEKKNLSEENIFTHTKGGLKRKAESNLDNENLVSTKKTKTVNLDKFSVQSNKNQLILKTKLELKEKVQRFKGQHFKEKKSIIKSPLKTDLNHKTKLTETNEFDQEINLLKNNEQNSLSKQCVYCEFLAPDKKSLVAHILGSCKNFNFSELITCPNCDVNVKVKCTNCASKCDIKGCTFSTWFKKVMLHHQAAGIHSFKCENCLLKTSNFIQFNSHICFTKSQSDQTEQPILTKQETGIFIPSKEFNNDLHYIDDYYISELPSVKKPAESLSKNHGRNDNFKQKLKNLDDNYIFYALNDSDDLNSSSEEDYVENQSTEKTSTVKEGSNSYFSSDDSKAFKTSTSQNKGQRTVNRIKQMRKQSQALKKKSNYSDSDFISEVEHSDFSDNDGISEVDDLDYSDKDLIPEVDDLDYSDSDCIPEVDNSDYLNSDYISEVSDSDDSLKEEQIENRNKSDKAIKTKSFTQNKTVTKAKKCKSSEDDYVPGSDDDDDDSVSSLETNRLRHSKHSNAEKTDYSTNNMVNKELSLKENTGDFDHLYPTETVEELKACQKCKYIMRGNKRPFLKRCPKCKHNHDHRENNELEILSKVFNKDLRNFKDIDINDTTEDWAQLKTCRRCGFVSIQLPILYQCRRCSFLHKNRIINKVKFMKKIKKFDVIDEDNISETPQQLQTCRKCGFYNRFAIMFYCDKCHYKHENRIKHEQELSKKNALKDAVENQNRKTNFEAEKQKKDKSPEMDKQKIDELPEMEKQKKYKIPEMEKQKKNEVPEMEKRKNDKIPKMEKQKKDKIPEIEKQNIDQTPKIKKQKKDEIKKQKEDKIPDRIKELKTCQNCGHYVPSTLVLKKCPNCSYRHKERFDNEFAILKEIHTYFETNEYKDYIPTETPAKLKTCRKCGHVSSKNVLKICPKCRHNHKDRRENQTQIKTFLRMQTLDCPGDPSPKEEQIKLIKTCRKCGFIGRDKILIRCDNCSYVHEDRCRYGNKILLRLYDETANRSRVCPKCNHVFNKSTLDFCPKCQHPRGTKGQTLTNAPNDAIEETEDIVETCKDLATCRNCGHSATSVIVLKKCPSCLFVHYDRFENEEKLIERAKKQLDDSDLELPKELKSCTKCGQEDAEKEYCDKCESHQRPVDSIQALSSANDIVETTEELKICEKCGVIGPIADEICSTCQLESTDLQNEEQFFDNSSNAEDTNDIGSPNNGTPSNPYDNFPNDALDDVPSDPINGGLANSEDDFELQYAEDLPENPVKTAKELPNDSLDKSVGIELLDDWIAKGENIEIIFEDENGLGVTGDFTLLKDLEHVN